MAVIMTVHNRRDTTIECLRQVFGQKGINDITLDVYLTDDGSTDGTAEAVRNNFPSVNIIQGDGSLFWNRGMYVAWKEAAKNDYDFYLWLNDDTMLFSNAIEALFRIEKDKGEDVIVVGSICAPNDHNRITYGGREDGVLIHPNGEIKTTKSFNGNVVLIPKKVFNMLGLNDPYYCHAFGDSDYGMRAYEHGFKCFVTEVFVGTCERHDDMRKCWNPKYKLLERLKFLYSPLGFPPKEIFYYKRRHWGLLRAIEAFIHCHIKTIFPNIK